MPQLFCASMNNNNSNKMTGNKIETCFLSFTLLAAWCNSLSEGKGVCGQASGRGLSSVLNPTDRTLSVEYCPELSKWVSRGPWFNAFFTEIVLFMQQCLCFHIIPGTKELTSCRATSQHDVRLLNSILFLQLKAYLASGREA